VVFFTGLTRRYSAALLIALSVAATPAMAANDSRAALIDLSKIHIDNFGRLNTNYYRGAQPKGQDYADLAGLGIKMVIDLTKDGDPGEMALAQKAGMKWLRIPMTTHETPTSEVIAQFLRVVTDPANQPVYVHCQGGRHRTGVMTAVYRMTQEGWTAAQAFAEMKQYKFGADFLHPEFKQFVYDYPAELAHATATSAVAATKSDR
jgi:tyrosine-protein phosphatase SIW14